MLLEMALPMKCLKCGHYHFDGKCYATVQILAGIYVGEYSEEIKDCKCAEADRSPKRGQWF